MSEHTFVGSLAHDISRKTGTDIPPRTISDLFYSRVLDNERCPILGGRRLIPRDYVPEVELALRERGLIPGLTGGTDL